MEDSCLFQKQRWKLYRSNFEPKETIEELVDKFQKLEVVEKVRKSMVRYSGNCANDLTDVLLEEILKKISITVYSDNPSQISGFMVNSIYQELESKSIRKSVLDEARKDLKHTVQQKLEDLQYSYETQLFQELEQKNVILENFIRSSFY